jgi:hypothetical protein
MVLADLGLCLSCPMTLGTDRQRNSEIRVVGVLLPSGSRGQLLKRQLPLGSQPCRDLKGARPRFEARAMAPRLATQRSHCASGCA